MKITRRQLRQIIKEELTSFSTMTGVKPGAEYAVYDEMNNYDIVGSYSQENGFRVNSAGRSLGHTGEIGPEDIAGTPEYREFVSQFDRLPENLHSPLTLSFIDPSLR